MQLSIAMAMGRVLIPNPSSTTFCRCAIGMGLAAIGHDFHSNGKDNSFHALGTAWDEWPWIKENGMTREISNRFSAVRHGLITLDQLIDWVRSVEPAEPQSAEGSQPCTSKPMTLFVHSATAIAT